MAGYKGHSMSNNAVAAYYSGEKPISKWTKQTILEEIEDNCDIEDSTLLLIKKLTLKELQSNFLSYASWHHTGKFYNQTTFYALDYEYVNNITRDNIDIIINNRKKREKRSPEEIAADKAVKAERQAQRLLKKEKEKLFKYQTKYKTLSGFMRSTTVELDKLRAIRMEKICERREKLRINWEKQGFTYGLDNIEDDDFVERYI